MELLASGDSDLGEASPPRYWRLGINPLAAPPRRWRAPEPARTRRRSNAGPVLKGMRQSAPPPAREGWWRGLEAAATRRVAHTWPVPEKNPLAAPHRRWRVPEPAVQRWPDSQGDTPVRSSPGPRGLMTGPGSGGDPSGGAHLTGPQSPPPPPPPRPARFVVGFGGGGALPVNFHRPGTHGANTADRAGWIYPPACRSLPPREAGIADACKRLSRRLPDLTHRWMPRLPRFRRPASPWLSLPSPWERKENHEEASCGPPTRASPDWEEAHKRGIKLAGA